MELFFNRREDRREDRREGLKEKLKSGIKRICGMTLRSQTQIACSDDIATLNAEIDNTSLDGGIMDDLNRAIDNMNLENPTDKDKDKDKDKEKFKAFIDELVKILINYYDILTKNETTELQNTDEIEKVRELLQRKFKDIKNDFNVNEAYDLIFLLLNMQKCHDNSENVNDLKRCINKLDNPSKEAGSRYDPANTKILIEHDRIEYDGIDPKRPRKNGGKKNKKKTKRNKKRKRRTYKKK